MPIAVTEAHIDATPRRPAALAARDLARRARARAHGGCRRARRHGLVAARLVRLELPARPSAAATTSPARSTCARRQPRPTALAALVARARRRTRAEPSGAAGRRLVAPRRALPRQAGRAARRRHAARRLSAASSPADRVAPDPRQRRERHARPRLRDDLRAAQPRLPAPRPRARWTSPTPARSPPRSRAGSRGRSSTRAATSASTRPSPTSSAACARTRVGPAVLAEACATAGIRLVTFSSDQVFDGRGERALGRKRRAGAAQRLRRAARPPPSATCSARCRERDGRAHERLLRPLGPAQLRRPRPRRARARARRSAPPTTCAISPTYVPDLVNVCLDLLIDGESRHLAPRQRRRRQLGRARGARGRAGRDRDVDAAALPRAPTSARSRRGRATVSSPASAPP